MLRGIVRRGFATYKSSTGLVGLRVDPNGRDTLLKLTGTVLTNIQKIPSSSQYRIDVEKWFIFIQNIANKSADIKTVEDEIGLGQIEEVIEMANTELELIDYYHENRVWELVENAQLKADARVEEMADSIYFNTERHPPVPPIDAKK